MVYRNARSMARWPSYCTLRYFSSQLSRTVDINKLSKLEPVIGLEIHAQIASQSKLFSGAGTKFSAQTNSQVALLDAAIPGTLPVLNKRCVEAAVKTAIALNCKINMVSKFDRKHYFYADLPAGYQITQQRQPIATGGEVPYLVFRQEKMKEAHRRTARLTQLQLEQDSGKSLYDAEDSQSLIDLNRAGMGLMEIVTEPVFRSADEAAGFVRELQQLLKLIGVCDGKMAEGSMRVDASVSMHYPGEPLGTRAEVKNLNSIRFVTKAIEYEIERQTQILEKEGEVNNETRSFDMVSGKTIPMRDKEKVHDYRFMPEPNLPPLRLYDNSTAPPGVDEGQIVNIDVLRNSLPELPEALRTLFTTKYGISLAETIIFMDNPSLIGPFKSIMEEGNRHTSVVATFFLRGILGQMNKRNITLDESGVQQAHLEELVDLIQEKKISQEFSGKVLDILINEPDARSLSAEKIITKNNWWLITDPELISKICRDILEQSPDLVKKYKKGKRPEKIIKTLISRIQKPKDYLIESEILRAVLVQELTS